MEKLNFTFVQDQDQDQMKKKLEKKIKGMKSIHNISTYFDKELELWKGIVWYK